jgi:hypothetical protein
MLRSPLSWLNSLFASLVLGLLVSAAAQAASPTPSASYIYTGQYNPGTFDALLGDNMRGKEPVDSADPVIPRFTWYGHPGNPSAEWVQYDWATPTTLSASGVYWWLDGRSIFLPTAYSLSYRDAAGAWVPVQLITPGYGIAADQYNWVSFVPVTTTGLRMNVTLQANQSAGISRWKTGTAIPSAPPTLPDLSTHILGKSQILGNLGIIEKAFFINNVPFIDSPDKDVAATRRRPGGSKA